MQRSGHLNFLTLESRMNALVIDLHDAARLSSDAGISAQLRLIAADMSDLVCKMRRLLVSDVDTDFGDL